MRAKSRPTAGAARLASSSSASHRRAAACHWKRARGVGRPVELRGGRRELRDQRRQRRIDRHRACAVEQTLRQRQRRGGQVEHELAILAEPGVFVARARRDQPCRMPVDAAADAVDRHHHRAVDAQHDLMEIVHVRRLARVVTAQRDGGRRHAFHREGVGRRQTASSSTSNTSVAFGGITPPAPRGP
jgi:hypothetical protein